MVREIMHDDTFSAQKAGPAAPEVPSTAQDLLDQIVNAQPSRCVDFEGLGTAAERLAELLRKMY